MPLLLLLPLSHMLLLLPHAAAAAATWCRGERLPERQQQQRVGDEGELHLQQQRGGLGGGGLFLPCWRGRWCGRGVLQGGGKQQHLRQQQQQQQQQQEEREAWVGSRGSWQEGGESVVGAGR